MSLARVMFLATLTGAHASCSSPMKLTCLQAKSDIEIDGDLKDWSEIKGMITPLHGIKQENYDKGEAMFKCVHTETHVFFSFQVPGRYRFNTTDNHYCAAVGTMFKIGSKATYVNMGGCPDATSKSQCSSGVPETCKGYEVDVGAHWELKTTERKKKYTVNSDTGNDLTANKDDEYSVSSWCRWDDDGDNAANEWEGAWDHSDATEGAVGDYFFELSRTLATASAVTDKQLEVGKTYEFGIAFWDPYEVQSTGWTDEGHFLTGCGNTWIDLVIGSQEGAETTSGAAQLAASTLMLAMAMCVLDSL